MGLALFWVTFCDSYIFMINFLSALRLLSFPTLFIGLVQLIFGLLSTFVFHDGVTLKFIDSAAFLLLISVIAIFMIQRGEEFKINYRESLIFVTFICLSCGLASAIPIMTIEAITFTDAVFEACCGLTRTGSTVLSHLDQQPKSFLLYRQFLQWLGGLGVVIFVVAILPMLNIGGMKILKAETPGPVKGEKITPRVMLTARYLWYVYIVLTVLCTLGYLATGMSWFDSIAHSLSTVSTGGFSTHDASIGYFNSRWVELNANIFMILGAINFGLHFRFGLGFKPKIYKKDEETRFFLWLIAGFTLLLFFILMIDGVFSSWSDGLLTSLFHLIAFMTSTGFGADDYTQWPEAAAFLLIVAAFMGGCSGSTAGGNKIIRMLLTFKLIRHQFRVLIHPKVVSTIRYNGRAVAPEVLSATMAFIAFVAATSLFMTLLLMATGLDFWSAFSAVAACLNVCGPGFGALGNNFQPVTDTVTWILTVAMLLGRLEFFTIVVLLMPSFWKD